MRFVPENMYLTATTGKHLILYSFLALVIIKSVMSLFATPFIWDDEYAWYSVSHGLVASGYGELFKLTHLYPVGYPLFLSPAHFFSENKIIIYHIMLVINCILTSSIIFPSYFILKQYISQIQAVLGSILISVIPAVTLYNFNLMTENLFIPLAVFSIWFLHESFVRNSIRWDILTGISVLFLYIIRDTSGVAFVIAFVIAEIFFIVFTRKEERIAVLKKKLILFSIILIPLIISLITIVFFSPRKSYVPYTLFLKAFQNSFSNVVSLSNGITYLLYHIEYLAIASYVILFILFSAIIAACLGKKNFFGLYSTLQKHFPERLHILRSTGLYCLTYGAGLLLMNITFLLGDPSWVKMNSPVLGRYIYPFLPAIFIFGIMGLGLLTKLNIEKKDIDKNLAIVSIPIIGLSFFILPYIYSQLINNCGLIFLGILYIFLPSPGVLLILLILFCIIPYIILKNGHTSNTIELLLIFFIIISLFFSLPTLVVEVNHVNNEKIRNQIGEYFTTFNSSNTSILFDKDCYSADPTNKNYGGWILYCNTKFWTSGKIVINSISKENMNRSDFIISNKWLPLNCLKTVNMLGVYKLYNTHAPLKPYQWGDDILFGTSGSAEQYQVSGWSYPEKNYTWTDGNNCSIKFILDTIPKQVFFTLQGRPYTSVNHTIQTAFFFVNTKQIHSPILMNNTFNNVTIPVQSTYFVKGENTITITLPNATSPKEKGIGKDNRALGIAVRNIKLSVNES